MVVLHNIHQQFSQTATLLLCLFQISENDVLFIHCPALAQRNGDALPLSFDMIKNKAPTSHYAVLGERRRDAPIVLHPEHAAVYTKLRTNERNEGNTTGDMLVHVYTQQFVKNLPILLTVCAVIA